MMENSAANASEGYIVLPITVANILEQHELSEYISIMEEENVTTVELFSLIIEDDLKDINACESLGTKLRFRKAIQYARRLFSDPVQRERVEQVTLQPDVKRIRLDDVLIPNVERIEIDEVLRSYKGKLVAEYHAQHKALDNTNRGKLLSAIFEHLIKTVQLNTIKGNWWKAMFEAIKLKFPEEANFEDVYKNKFASVKYNLSKNLKSVNAAGPSSSKTNPNPVVVDETDDISEEEATKAKEWLANMREPWSMVQDKWRTSFQLRWAMYQSPDYARIDDFWSDDQWSILKTPKAIELIKLDFEKMFPSIKANLADKWSTLKNAILKYADMNLKNKNHRAALEHFKKEKSNDFFFIKVLSACLPSGNVLPKFRPNSEESLNACVREVMTLAEMHTSLDEYRNTLREHKLTLQPHVIFVNGQTKHYLIYLDHGRYYSADGLLEAIDGVIKLSMVFNTEYPPDARPIWTFFQTYCYGITTSHDHSFNCVNTLVAYLKDKQ